MVKLNTKKHPFYKSLFFAIKGFIYLLKKERNFQIEIGALLINLFLIIYLKLDKIDVVLILGVCFLVLIAEASNTALEKICDFLHPEFDERIGIIKDIAAAAVWLSALLSLVIGAIVYSSYIL